MTRSVSIGRGNVGQARLPERLPSEGAGLVGQTISQELGNLRRDLGRTAQVLVGQEQAENAKLERAQAHGQLKLGAEVTNNVLLDIGQQIADAPDEITGSVEGMAELENQIIQNAEVSFQRFRTENKLNKQAAQAWDATLPSIREKIQGAARRGIRDQSRRMLRGRANTSGNDRIEALGLVETMGPAEVVDIEATFDQVEQQENMLRARDWTTDLFSQDEINAKASIWSQKAYTEVLAQAYDRDPAEGAALAMSLPDTLPNAFVREHQQAAHRQIRAHYDPIRGNFGLITLRRDTALTPTDRLEMAQVPGSTEGIFASKHATLQAKELDFFMNQTTIRNVLGDGAVAGTEESFRSARSLLVQQESLQLTSEMMFLGPLYGGAGPFDPTTNLAAEQAMQGRLESYRQIPDARQFAQEFTNDVQAAGTFTTTSANYLHQLWSSQDPQEQARAAAAMGQLHKKGINFMQGPGTQRRAREDVEELRKVLGLPAGESLRVLSDEDTLDMLSVDERMTRLKVSPAKAVEIVRLLRENPPEAQVLETDFTENHLEGGAVALNKRIDTWSLFPDRGAGLKIPAQMMFDFNSLRRDHYLTSGGQIGPSDNWAWTKLQMTWGITDDGGTGDDRWALNPPEVTYQGNGDVEWIGPDLQKDALEAVGRELKNAQLTPIENPDDPDSPFYAVEELGAEGFFVPVHRKGSSPDDPNLFFYQTTFEGSPKSKELRAEKDRMTKFVLQRKFIPQLALLEEQMYEVLGSIEPTTPEDERFVRSVNRSIAMIQNTRREGTARSVTVEMFNDALKQMKGAFPFTDAELEARGITPVRWKGFKELRLEKTRPHQPDQQDPSKTGPED